MADTLTFAKAPNLIYATCGCLPAASTTKKNKFVSKATTLAAGEIHWTTHPWFPGTAMAIVPIITQHADTDDNVTPALIVGHPSEIPSSPVEVTEATDLSAVKVRFELYARTRE